MSDRTVKVTLKAEVAEFKRALGEASKAADDVGKKAQSSAKSSTTAMGQMVTSADKHGEAWTKVGTGVLGAGVAIAAGVGLAVSKFADFDAAMSEAQAGTTATGQALGDLRAAAIAGGAATKFSATEAAQAITEMGKAGVSTKDILGGGLTGALDLAAAGQISVGRAGEIAATAMNQFNLAGKDLPHVADLMAAGAGKAQGSVDDMANALKFVGPVAKNLNVSIEETTGVIAELASQGIIGEQAGTSMRGMLLSLTSPSKAAATAMSDLGLNMYDANGKFIGLDGAAQQLQDRMGGLDDATRNEAMGRIFGNEQITAATILYDGGAAAVNEWTDKVNDSGFAARQAATLTDNLKGDVERLGGSLDTALIQTGSGANDVLRSLAQTAEGAVNAFGALDPATLKVALGVTAVVGAAAILGGGFLVLAPRIVETRKAMDVLSTSMPKTSAAMGALGKAAGVAGIALTAAAAAGALFGYDADPKSVTEYTTALLGMGDAGGAIKMTGYDVQGLGEAFKTLTDPSAMDSFDKWSSSVTGGLVGRDEISILGTEFKTLGQSLAEMYASDPAAAASKFKDVLKQTGGTSAELLELMPAYRDALDGAANSSTLAAGATEFGTLKIDEQIVSLKDLLDIQQDAAGINMSAAEAEAAWAEQIMGNRGALEGLNKIIDENKQGTRDASDAVTEGGAALDLYTEAGQYASDQLLSTSKSAWTLIDAADNAGASADDLRAKTETARAEFITTAMQMGLSAEAAGALADSYGLIPENIKTKAELNKAQAEADLAALAAQVAALPDGVVNISTVGAAGVYTYLQNIQNAMNTINGTHVRIANGQGGQGGQTFAEGGYTGSGGKYEPAGIVHRGEYVVKASDTRRIGVANLRAMTGYANGGFVSGGSASSGAAAAGSSPVIGTLNAYGYDPSDAVRQFGHEMSWAMKG